jgi:hypothetical protein
MDQDSSRAERTPRTRWMTLGAGWALVTVGAALLVLPGPGIPLLLGGLALLGRELPWARRLRARIEERVARAVGRARSGGAVGARDGAD